ncbi:hypothetical protein B0H16DRAFT_1459078 [Mycena metata]|uniref:Uncharacterized protein n=1 Tax=Mycena metata TaxID=1033252 RepID=A0AAD7J129_9AGAR|nr:hypothetical protein B0H16DRAFT_1459078 [Mycena metata]
MVPETDQNEVLDHFSLNLSPYSKKSRPIFTGDVVACWLDAPASVPNPRLVGPRTVNLIQFCVPPGNQHKPFLRRSVLKGKYGGAEIKNLLTKRRAEPSLKGCCRRLKWSQDIVVIEAIGLNSKGLDGNLLAAQETLEDNHTWNQQYHSVIQERRATGVQTRESSEGKIWEGVAGGSNLGPGSTAMGSGRGRSLNVTNGIQISAD